MVKKKVLLTKSKYLQGLQCPHLLWVAGHEPARIVIDASTQATFDQGHEVGRLAQGLFPGGLVLDTDDFAGNLRASRDALSDHSPVFEAGFAAGRLYCRVDVLAPEGDGWALIEVKSSTEVKQENLEDVAFQREVLTQAGVEVKRCFVMHINNRYVRQGPVDPGQLFSWREVTEDIAGLSAGSAERTADMTAVLDGPCPDGAIGHRCLSPYSCPLIGECWASLPDHHVLTLSHDRQLGEELLRRGILNIADIPAEVALSPKQCIQRDCVVRGVPFIDHAGLRDFLNKLSYPLSYLDFETFQLAIPPYDGVRPYQQIAFQFSLHRQERAGSLPTHHAYLAEGPADPRPGLMDALQTHIGAKGSVLAYNKSFEAQRLAEMAEALPEHRPWVDELLGRLTDLAGPFRDFQYYHPSQDGSYSLKCVLPALTGEGYGGLEIGNGGTASLSYLAAAFGDLDAAARAKVRADLLRYCALDTSGMVSIVGGLRAMCSGSRQLPLMP
jgi:hypothetical protein